MLPWTRLLIPSELDLELKLALKIAVLVPYGFDLDLKNAFKIDPKSISKGILARNQLQRQFSSRLGRLQACFLGL